MVVSIVEATVEDIPAIIAFGKEAFTRTFGHLYTAKDLHDYLAEAYTVELFREWITNDKYGIWLAWSNNENELEHDRSIGGYVLCSPNGLPLPSPVDNAGEVKRLYLHPSHFGTGLAAALMEVAMRWLKERYQNNIYLGVYSENFRAQRFYEHQGFKPCGEYSFQVGDSFDREFIYKYQG